MKYTVPKKKYYPPRPKVDRPLPTTDELVGKVVEKIKEKAKVDVPTEVEK